MQKEIEYKINNGTIECVETNTFVHEVSKEEFEKEMARYSNLINIAKKELRRLDFEFRKLEHDLPKVTKLEEELKQQKENDKTN